LLLRGFHKSRPAELLRIPVWSDQRSGDIRSLIPASDHGSGAFGQPFRSFDLAQLRADLAEVCVRIAAEQIEIERASMG
jgi:hypothetical protein